MSLLVSLLLPVALDLKALPASDLQGWIVPSDLPNVPDDALGGLVFVNLAVSADGQLTGCRPDLPAGEGEPMIALGKRYCDLLLLRARFAPRAESMPWHVRAVVHLQNADAPPAPGSPQRLPAPAPPVENVGSAVAAANWTTSPPASRSLRRGPLPHKPALWITELDYPPEARQARLSGYVGFALSVGADGMPTACTITRSSNAAALDAATCRLVMARARFAPAVDAVGTPVPSTYSLTVRWVPPMDDRAPETPPPGLAGGVNQP